MKKCQLLLWPLFDSAFFGKNGHSCRLSFQASFSKLCPIMHDDPDCIDIPAMPRRNHSLPKHAAKLQNASLSNFMDYYNDGPLRLHSVSSSII